MFADAQDPPGKPVGEVSTPEPPRLPTRIAHFDLDTFFVAVERARRPELRGFPVLVGGRSGRGVVAAASYESRVFGCHSAQPMSQALRLCPQAIVVRPDQSEYRRVSGLFHEMLREVSPLVDSVGIDEAYVDLTGLTWEAVRIAGAGLEAGTPAAATAELVRVRVRRELGIRVSVCIAGSRTTAKVGSDRAKPDGLIEVPPGGDRAFLAPVAVRELPMVGPRMGEALSTAGVRTIGDLARLDRRWLELRFGRSGLVLAAHARGCDPDPVRASGPRNRSISREETFTRDESERGVLEGTLARQAERVGAELRRSERRARTVTLKLRWHDFETVTRAHTVERPIHSTAALRDVSWALLDEVLRSPGARGAAASGRPGASGNQAPWPLRPVRLIGLGVTNLVANQIQLDFDRLLGGAVAGGEPTEDRVDRTLDGLNERFGSRAVRRGFAAGGRGASDGAVGQ